MCQVASRSETRGVIWLKVKLDHIGILVEKLDETIIEFYRKVLRCERAKYFHMKNEDEEINYVYLHFRKEDNYVELLASVRGPSLEYLKKKRRGNMFEPCVEVDNIEEF